MLNTFRHCLGGIYKEQYFELVERDRITNNDEFTDVAGDGDCRFGIVGTVDTLYSCYLNGGQWKKDQVSMKQYNQLKALEETVTNPIKRFEGLTLDDVCGDNIIMTVNEHFSRILK